jgi:hypothetical protein
MEIETERAAATNFDTLLIGSPPNVSPPSAELISFLRGALADTRRLASICIGAFILGEAGLLDGRRATTHWLFAKELQGRFPKASVEVDRIFIADGQVWTSAGMTAGLDMALGLVERDVGPEKTRDAARTLVLHHRRSGGQSQHSALLDLDAKSDRIQSALREAAAHPFPIAKPCLGSDCLDREAALLEHQPGCFQSQVLNSFRRGQAGLGTKHAAELPRAEAGGISQFLHGKRFAEVAPGKLPAFGQTPQAIRNASHPLASF